MPSRSAPASDAVTAWAVPEARIVAFNRFHRPHPANPYPPQPLDYLLLSDPCKQFLPEPPTVLPAAAQPVQNRTQQNRTMPKFWRVRPA